MQAKPLILSQLGLAFTDRRRQLTAARIAIKPNLPVHDFKDYSRERLIVSSDPKRPCPHCGGSEVFRSHSRGPTERYLLHAVGVRPFRCVNCNARFYRLKRSDGSESQDIKAA